MLAWLVYLVIDEQPRFHLSVFPATLRLHLLVAALTAAYAAYLVARKRLPGPTRLDWPVAGLVVVYAAATLDSIYPRVSFEAALVIGIPVLVFYAFHDIDFLTPDILVRGLAACGAIAAVAALGNVVSDYVNWFELMSAVDGSSGLPPSIPRVHDVGGNVNALAMALNLTLPFALLLMVRPSVRWDRPFGVLTAALILLTLFFTISRGGWLGTIASLSAFGTLYLLRQRDLKAILAPVLHNPRRLLAGLAVVAVLGLVGIGLIATRWESRPDWLFRASLGPRADAMQVGLDIFRDRPWFGAGPGTYPLLYNALSGEYPVENIHPHNGYLAVLDDIGLAGAIVLLAGGGVIVFSLVTGFSRLDSSRRLTLAACTAALISLAVHSLLDSPLIWNTALVPLAVVLALTFRTAVPVAPSLRMPSNVQLVPRIGILAVAPVLLAGWLVLDLRHATFHDSLVDLSNGRFDEAALTAADAAAADPASAAAHIHAGVTQAITYLIDTRNGADPLDTSVLDLAEQHFRTAVRHEPRSAIGYANLSLVLRLHASALPATSIDGLRLKAEAVDAAERAVSLAPTDGAVALAAGTVQEWAEQYDAAMDAYTIAIKRDPSLVQSPFWGANPRRLELRRNALLNSDLSRCEWGRNSAIYGGFEDDFNMLATACRDEVAEKPNDPKLRAALAIILQRQGNAGEAISEAEEAVSRVPDNPFARTALGIIRGAQGNIEAARHEFAISSYLRDPGDPDAALLLAYTYEPPPASVQVASNLQLPAEPGNLPRPVRDRLRIAYNVASPVVFEDGRQRYLLGILYYRVRFFRESPTSILIPGEWLEFSSPRALLLADALKSP